MIGSKLLKWYELNKRDLPWRKTIDPYLIWISEIILQQTRVAQGMDYYLRFTHSYPNVEALANANENDILVLWQGLGYYSRARNLHFAAKTIIEQHNGIFPTDHKDILKLKGIGEYTSAAICSFAYNEPYAVVDGNVFRVLSRLFGIYTPINTGSGKKEFTELANELLDKKQPGLYNQAIMEFGALHCTPDNPKCAKCPFSEGCVAYNTNSVKLLPFKQGKTKVKDRYFYYLDIRFDNNPSIIVLSKRTKKDIWQNLYELPLIETEKNIDMEELVGSNQFKALFRHPQKIRVNPMSIAFKHILSHQKIYANFIEINISSDNCLNEDFTHIDISEIDNYPISRLVDRYFEKKNKPDLFS